MKTKIRIRVKIVIIVALCFLSVEHVSAASKSSDRRKRDQWASFFKDLEKDPFKSIEAFGNKDGVDVTDGGTQVTDAKSPIKTTITVEGPASGSEEDNQPHVVNNIDSGNGEDVSIDSLLSEMGALLSGVKGMSSQSDDTPKLSLPKSTPKSVETSKKESEEKEPEKKEKDVKSEEVASEEHVVVEIAEPKADLAPRSEEYEDSNSKEHERTTPPPLSLNLTHFKLLGDGVPKVIMSANQDPKMPNAKPGALTISQPKTFSIGATIANPLAGSYIHTHGPTHGRSQGHSHSPSHREHVHGKSHHEAVKNGMQQLSNMQSSPNITTRSRKNDTSYQGNKNGENFMDSVKNMMDGFGKVQTTTTEKPITTSKRPITPTTSKPGNKLSSINFSPVKAFSTTPSSVISTTEEEFEYYDSDEETTTVTPKPALKITTTKFPQIKSTTEPDYESESEEVTQTTTTLSPMDAVSMTNVDSYLAKYFSSKFTPPKNNPKSPDDRGSKYDHVHSNDHHDDNSHSHGNHGKSHSHGNDHHDDKPVKYSNTDTSGKLVFRKNPFQTTTQRPCHDSKCKVTDSKSPPKSNDTKPATTSTSLYFPALNTFAPNSTSPLTAFSTRHVSPVTTENPVTTSIGTNGLSDSDFGTSTFEPTSTPTITSTLPTTSLTTTTIGTTSTTAHLTTSLAPTTRKPTTTTTHRPHHRSQTTEEPHTTTTVKPTESHHEDHVHHHNHTHENKTHENKTAPAFISPEEFIKLVTQQFEAGNKTNSSSDTFKMFSLPIMSRSLFGPKTNQTTVENPPANETEPIAPDEMSGEDDMTPKPVKGKHRLKKGKKGSKRRHNKLSSAKGHKGGNKKQLDKSEKVMAKKKAQLLGKNRSSNKYPLKGRGKLDKHRKSRIDDDDDQNFNDAENDKETRKTPDFLVEFEKNMKRSKSGTQKTLTEIGVPGMKYQSADAKKGMAKPPQKKTTSIIITSRSAPREETKLEKKRKQVYSTSSERIITQKPIRPLKYKDKSN